MIQKFRKWKKLYIGNKFGYWNKTWFFGQNFGFENKILLDKIWFVDKSTLFGQNYDFWTKFFFLNFFFLIFGNLTQNFKIFHQKNMPFSNYSFITSGAVAIVPNDIRRSVISPNIPKTDQICTVAKLGTWSVFVTLVTIFATSTDNFTIENISTVIPTFKF